MSNMFSRFNKVARMILAADAQKVVNHALELIDKVDEPGSQKEGFAKLLNLAKTEGFVKYDTSNKLQQAIERIEKSEKPTDEDLNSIKELAQQFIDNIQKAATPSEDETIQEPAKEISEKPAKEPANQNENNTNITNKEPEQDGEIESKFPVKQIKANCLKSNKWLAVKFPPKHLNNYTNLIKELKTMKVLDLDYKDLFQKAVEGTTYEINERTVNLCKSFKKMYEQNYKLFSEIPMDKLFTNLAGLQKIITYLARTIGWGGYESTVQALIDSIDFGNKIQQQTKEFDGYYNYLSETYCQGSDKKAALNFTNIKKHNYIFNNSQKFWNLVLDLFKNVQILAAFLRSYTWAVYTFLNDTKATIKNKKDITEHAEFQGMMHGNVKSIAKFVKNNKYFKTKIEVNKKEKTT